MANPDSNYYKRLDVSGIIMDGDTQEKLLRGCITSWYIRKFILYYFVFIK